MLNISFPSKRARRWSRTTDMSSTDRRLWPLSYSGKNRRLVGITHKLRPPETPEVTAKLLVPAGTLSPHGRTYIRRDLRTVLTRFPALSRAFPYAVPSWLNSGTELFSTRLRSWASGIQTPRRPCCRRSTPTLGDTSLVPRKCRRIAGYFVISHAQRQTW